MTKTITVTTQLENEDNMKIGQLIDGYVKPGTVVGVNCISDSMVVIAFKIIVDDIKNFKRDLNLLNIMGIRGRFMVL